MSTDQQRKTVITAGLKDIASRSTIHGISNIVSSQSKFIKLLWSVAFLGCFGLVVSQLVDIFTLYRSYPMKTTFKLEKNIEFPAITICNMKRYIKPYIVHVRDETLNMAIDQYKDKMGNFTPHELIDMCRINRTHCEFIDLYDNITRHYIAYLTWLSTQYGNCFTIEPSQKLANVYGLSGEIYFLINLENHFEFLSLRSGVRVVVHDNGTLPMPFEEGVTIKGGDEAFISIKLTETRRLGKPHGVCESDLNFDGYKYTIKACMQICWERHLLTKCGCMNEREEESLIFRKQEVRPPDCYIKPEYFHCFENVKANFINNPGIHCDCPGACSEHLYEMQVSSSKAFDYFSDEVSKGELDDYAKYLCNSVHHVPYQQGCPLDTIILDFGIIKQELPSYKVSIKVVNPFEAVFNRTKAFGKTTSLRQNFVKLHFYLRDPLHETRQEEPLYSETEMMADIGGSLGLFIGASVLSLGELIEIIGVCWRFLFKKRNTTSSIDIDVQKDNQNLSSHTEEKNIKQCEGI